jgi:hypothetical protein
MCLFLFLQQGLKTLVHLIDLNLGEGDPGGMPPEKQTFLVINIQGIVLVIFKKRTKNTSPAGLRLIEQGTGPNLGEADPGGLGACPQKTSLFLVIYMGCDCSF